MSASTPATQVPCSSLFLLHLLFFVMRLLLDNRAQSIQIGAVLLFGMIVILLSMWQANGIPNQNEEIEFDHNQQIQQQLTELRSTVTTMPTAGTSQSVTLDLGVRYPSRVLFVNPPPVTGTIETVRTSNSSYNITVDNANPTNDELSQLWNQSGSEYNTGAIAYQATYNEYRNDPRTVYQHSVLYNEFDDDELPITEQAIVRDNHISLIAVNGTLRESRGNAISIDFEPISTQTREVKIQPDNGPIVIELPTTMSENRWKKLFEDESNVKDVTVDLGAFSDEDLGLLRIELREDPVGSQDAYRLQLAKVGVGTGTTGTGAEYLTPVAGNETTVQSGQVQTLTLEVRDEFNKPLDGVSISGSAEQGTFVGDATQNTSRGGQVSYDYKASNGGTHQLNFTAKSDYNPDSSHDVTDPLNVTMSVTVQSTTSSSQLPGPEPIRLELESDEVSEGDTLDIVNASFDNRGTTAQRRGGTEVIAGEYYIEEIDTPSNGDGTPLTYDTSLYNNLSVKMTGEIDTGTLNGPGQYTVAIRGQDARGIWTNTSVDGITNDTFEVVAATQQSKLEGVAGTTPDGESYYLTFDLKNTGTIDATLINFSISTPGVTAVNNIDRGKNTDEVQVGTGYATPDYGSTDTSFAMGSVYAFDRNGNAGRGSEPTIGSGSTVSVDMGDFDNGNVALKYVLTDDAAQSDLTVTFGLDDGTTHDVYFNVTNVNT